MNIREHIEAGHYPKDTLGRPQVPGDDGGTWSIICTDKPYGNPVVGFRNSDGMIGSFGDDPQSKYTIHLLPPPPRKVKVTRWAEIRLADQSRMTTFATCDVRPGKGHIMVELTGEYEEPWP